jgi:hypothetical protein
MTRHEQLIAARALAALARVSAADLERALKDPDGLAAGDVLRATSEIMSAANATIANANAAVSIYSDWLNKRGSDRAE